ncbi:hypothetical protein C5S53_11155 [Methanophagales archaeon]|jgi:hypothetical protein|nr:hypothetical protein C5S53_11155 [Methanophagales archaeon]
MNLICLRTGREKLLIRLEINVRYGIGGLAIENFSKKKKKIGRNDPCPCGSGKKYKKCCLRKDIL